MEALQQPTINVVAVIAEGVPEADTKKLIAYAHAHNKVLLGPATVGGIQVGLTERTLSWPPTAVNLAIARTFIADARCLCVRDQHMRYACSQGRSAVWADAPKRGNAHLVEDVYINQPYCADSVRPSC